MPVTYIIISSVLQNVRKTTRGYIQLIRPYSAYLLPCIVLLGAISNNGFDYFYLLVLFIIGLCFHVVGNVQNDYFDFEIDKRSIYASRRPIVTDVISLKNAFFIWVFFVLLALILTIIFFSRVSVIILFVISFSLLTIYNKYSKHMPGMEFILGGAVFFSVLFGAYAVCDTLVPLSVIVAVLIFIKYTFNVGISANIKDISYDQQLGLKTTPMTFGVKTKDDVIFIPKKFIFYAFGLKFIYIGVALIPLIVGYTQPSVYNIPFPLILFILCSIGILYTIHMIFSAYTGHRDRMLLYAAGHEFLTYALIPILMSSILIEHFSFFIFLVFLFGPPLWMIISLKIFFEQGKPHE